VAKNNLMLHRRMW